MLSEPIAQSDYIKRRLLSLKIYLSKYPYSKKELDFKTYKVGLNVENLI
jgi:hypothetical protein